MFWMRYLDFASHFLSRACLGVFLGSVGIFETCSKNTIPCSMAQQQYQNAGGWLFLPVSTAERREPRKPIRSAHEMPPLATTHKQA